MITAADIEARLPHVSTWPSTTWDLTDPEERAEAVAWLLAVYERAASNTCATLEFTEVAA